MAVTVIPKEPCAELESASVSVVVHDPEQLEGENDAVTPVGSPDALKDGAALPVAVAVMELVVEPPDVTETEVGLADRLKLEVVGGGGDETLTPILAEPESVPLVPVTVTVEEP